MTIEHKNDILYSVIQRTDSLNVYRELKKILS